MLRRLAFALPVLLVLLPAVHAADPAKVKQKLYVTNSDGDDITVIDTATNKVIGRIEVGLHPHGIAVPAAQDFILVTIEGTKPGQLVWIDPVTDKVTQKMDIGPAPNQLAVTPDGKTAYVPCSDGNWQVIDVPNKKIVESIYVGGRPHNTLSSLGIEEADVASRKMTHRVPSELTDDQKKVASRSHGIAVSPNQKEVWTCDVEHHEVQVFDITGDKPKQIKTIPMEGAVYWLTWHPDGKTAYIAVRGKDAVAVVDVETKKVTGHVPAGKVPKRLIVVTVPEKK